MAPINLDDIIHNHPPVKRPHFKPLQVPGHHARILSRSSFNAPAPAHPPLHGQHGRLGPPLSGHPPYLQGHFNASSEAETLSAPNKFAEEVTIDCSNEFDMDVLNAFSGKDANVAISNIHTASRELQKVHSQTEADEIAGQCSLSQRSCPAPGSRGRKQTKPRWREILCDIRTRQ